ncbi:hypothetical protein LTR96_009696 [Exophiala xenobiotica]|uniref:ADF-H domain-containing protein n=1 Tax=Vermiconidia calcicola TaxID=1690605 RepID=A0AAV9PZ01_9PEZI|nr:hypothetical protein LTR92_000848 [Exophiala xenobiotica]KAK5532369.1 hypothetical protein LTR25_007902 [Vermiconidia calcicola]KAK5541907.1 hypothetical protein LTR23_005509 [Chaetothyriales sp. CCFEE 6169]KAK5217441.1 hypothetical protein LTR72_009558 [Exophiala xenobiotica]KAK5264897.1 hypothetical protein LTR96_009696 [Exophiala xenobiotica]
MEDKFAGYAAAERWAKLGRGREKCLANWERREYIERETERGERDRKQRENVVWVMVLMDFGKSSSESRLYTFSQETKDQLRKFRLGTSRAKTPMAKIYQIDIKTQEIKASSDDTYTDMLELADELPDSSPRFVLLSYPLTLPSGRLSVPYVLIYYLPVNCNPNMRMSYAGAVELMRGTAEVNRVIEISEAEDLQEIEEKLKGED